MQQQSAFTWVPFYTELADKLVPYANDRPALTEKIKTVYQKIGMKLPTLDIDGNVRDIDPFSVFGLFNKGITVKNRIKILEGIAAEFGVEAPVPKEFMGIPVLNNQMATFYAPDGPTKKQDIDNLWDVFIYALQYADHRDNDILVKFCDSYDAALRQKCVKWNITMGLFWIRPNRYINLDSTNREFIKNPEHTDEEFVQYLPKFTHVPQAFEYINFCDSCLHMLKNTKHPYKTLPEMSVYARMENKADGKGAGKVNALSDDTSLDVHYWMYTVYDDASWDECRQKGIIVLGFDEIGALDQYASKQEIRLSLINSYDENGTIDSNDVEASDGSGNVVKRSSRRNQALMAWNFANEIKPDDVIFAKRANTLIGKGIVTGAYVFDESRTNYKNIRTVEWQKTGTWEHPGKAVAKRLTDISQYTDYIANLKNIFADETIDEDIDDSEVTYPTYLPEDFLRDVYMSGEDYETIVDVLMSKKNIILQGAPGVGKTYAAKRLAYSIMGEKNKERVMMIQFHQSYSYEDFIMGFRPCANGFELKKGAFYNFCKKAEEDSENDYFFIIDEINRGNLSKIFGELFMLIETDKRGIELQLLYSDEQFSVPENLYIIGMMNTADRSLAMLDYALRRRFAFIALKPGFETDGFRKYRTDLDNDKFNRLITCIENLNAAISADESLGEGFCIGHSYFCNLTKDTINDRTLSAIVEFEIIPLLKEYWFDEPTKVHDWSSDLRSAVR